MSAFKKLNIYNYPFIVSKSINEISDFIIKSINNFKMEDNLPIVLPINVDLLIKLEYKFPELQSILKKSFLILPDGQPIVFSSRILTKNSEQFRRLAGSDLFPSIWEKVKKNKIKVLLIVPSENVKSKLEEEYPEATFFIPPYISFPKEKDKLFEIVENIFEIIQEENIELVLLGIGFPKQEIISLNLAQKFIENKQKSPIFLNLGASFEFYIGEKRRAPKFLQEIGLEWFYRFLQEPRRLFKRYFIDDIKFIFLFLKELKKRESYVSKK